MSHTRGPWSIGASNVTVYANDGAALISQQGADVPNNERVANARLIAAAPDLLAALKMINFIDPEVFSVIGIGAARASQNAIAKAEGSNSGGSS